MVAYILTQLPKGSDFNRLLLPRIAFHTTGIPDTSTKSGLSLPNKKRIGDIQGGCRCIYGLGFCVIVTLSK